LGHPQDYDIIDSFSVSNIANDSWQVSIMSYFDQDENTSVNATYARQITPMLADYLALREMYGAVPVRAGATTYGVNSTAGGALDKVTSLGSMATFLIADSGGSDRVDFSSFSGGQLINLRPGAFSNVMGAVGNMQIATDTIIETAIGGSGRDRLIGNGANNILNGRGDVDRLEGGAGNDSYYCTAGDLVIEGASAGTDRMLSFGNIVLAANVENGHALGSAAASLRGNVLNNTLIGNSAANVLNGGAGSDTLRGGGGNDTYYTNGGETIIEQTGGGVDGVRSAVNLVLPAHVESLTLTGTATRGSGNAINNTLIGNSVANVLNGCAGNDILTGGGGADHFVFGDGLDRVRDFQDDVDTLMFIGRQLGVSTTAQVMACAVQSGASVIFDFENDDLFVLNATIAALRNDVEMI
jgi:serralysin